MLIHKVASSAEASRRVRELFELVGLDPANADRYPHEFSGGQRQRIGIARALALRPSLVVAVMAELQERLGLTYLFIAHDLAVVRHVSDRVGVMYLGQIVELADVDPLYGAPLHPYTEALLSVAPELDDGEAPAREWIVLRGDVPDPSHRPAGCPFHPRCPVAQDRCRAEPPPLREVLPGRVVACHYPRNLDAAAALAGLGPGGEVGIGGSGLGAGGLWAGGLERRALPPAGSAAAEPPLVGEG
jgi:oligopeptide/dipeptide ABC transporter ATP-binding protein